MSLFTVNIDSSEFKGLGDGLEEALQAACETASQELAAAAHAKVIELAQEQLHSRREKYIEALSLRQEGGVWVLALDGSAAWIEDGMPAHNMLDALLSSPKAQRAKDGSTYLVVPFEHGPGKGPGTDWAPHQDLVDTLKKEMKKGVFDKMSKDPTKRTKIPWSEIERDDQGKPKMGRLHSFNIDHKPTKSHEGPGQGRGPQGDVRQGPNERQVVGGGPAGGGTPFLQGVAVYQSPGEEGGVKRSVMTFRIASSKHEGQERWNHPGLEPAGLMDQAWTWAMEEVEKTILPKLAESVWTKI